MCFKWGENGNMTLKEKITQIRKLIISTDVNPTTFDYVDKLLDIERKLWDMMYFIENQEKNWLVK